MMNHIRFFSTMITKEVIQKPFLSEGFMTAWQIDKFGTIDELKLSESTKVPELNKPNTMRVKVLASAANPLDSYMIGGYGNVVLDCIKKFNGLCENTESVSFPLIPGRDFCGEIVCKGPDVRRDIKVGDLVYGVIPPHMQGSHAEQLVIEDNLVCHTPDGLSPLEAASIPYAAMTAWSALKISGDLTVVDPKSQRVLVLGASGGVGTAAVQMLKAWGSTVVATCSPDAIELVSYLNPDIVIDYTQKESLREIELAGNYDIILDACGNVDSTTYSPFLKEWANSKFITLRSPFLKNTDSFGLLGGMIKNAATLVESNITTGALKKGATVRWGFFAPLGVALTEINNLVKSEQIKPVIDSVYQYKDMPNAYRRMSEGHLRGKVVVSHLENLN